MQRSTLGAPATSQATHIPETGTRLSAEEIHDNIMSEANEELERAAPSLLLSSFASGLAIGFSFLAGAFAASLVSEPYRHAAASAAYPLGFVFVILARSELFTENTLTPVLPLLHRRDAGTFGRMLRVWGLLLAGNLAGTLLFAWVVARTPAVPAALQPHLLQLAERATSTGFGLTLYHGIFAGWLIALLAWLLASTRYTGAQLALIWLVTAPIAAFEFKHSIVGSAEAFYRAWQDSAWWGSAIGFVTAAVIGNAIGGVLLVAILNYGQVVAERREKHEDEETGSR